MTELNRVRPANRIDPRAGLRSDRIASRVDPAARVGFGLRIGGMQPRVAIGLLASLIAFAGLSPTAGAADAGHEGLRAHGPGTVFHSVEAAALDALSYAHLEETPIDRERLRVGAIYRVANGYSYTVAKRSGAPSPLMAPSVRYRLRAVDVARYVIPPRRGPGQIDRLNEEPSHKEKQIVDEVDPRHRPLYQLTPSLNIVSYRYGGETTVITNLSELASLAAEKPVSAAKQALPAPESTTLFARCNWVTTRD